MFAQLPFDSFAGVAKTPRQIFDPIDFLAAEHDRQQRLCDMLARLALNPYHDGYQTAAEIIATYLTRDHPLHIVEEEVDLFTLLGRRTDSAGALDRLFDRLAQGHEVETRLAEQIMGELWRLAATRDPVNKAKFIADAFEFEQIWRRHLGWEEHELMPLARATLTETDRRQLATHFAARRGIPCAPANVA